MLKQANLIVHDGIHMNSDRILGQNLKRSMFIILRSIKCYIHLLRRNIKGEHPHVHLGVAVHTGYDKEDARPPSPTRKKTAKAEDDCSLILLKTGAGQADEPLIDMSPGLL